MRTALAIGLAATAFLPAAASAQSDGKSFRDWTAGCDNLKSCAALSLPEDGADTVGYLKLERPGGPTGAASLSLKLVGEKLKAPQSVRLSLDGAPFPAAGRTMAAALPDEETAVVAFSEADTASLIAAARKATKLSATMAGKSYTISLAGSVAALVWIDEQQGRLNTVTALIRKGDAAAGTVPPAPALPVITARPTAAPLDKKAAKALGAALRKHLKTAAPDACEDNDGATSSPDQVWPLSATQKLIGLYCGSGAYNVITGYWTVSGNAIASARSVAFPRQDDNMLINSEYEPKTGQIGFFAKGRGIGDCGSSGNYAWTGSGFALTAFAMMGECRGLPPDDWLTLFRSEVKLGQ
jgi:hypothetical protein